MPIHINVIKVSFKCALSILCVFKYFFGWGTYADGALLMNISFIWVIYRSYPRSLMRRGYIEKYGNILIITHATNSVKIHRKCCYMHPISHSLFILECLKKNIFLLAHFLLLNLDHFSCFSGPFYSFISSQHWSSTQSNVRAYCKSMLRIQLESILC